MEPTPIRRIHRGPFVDFSVIDRSYTSEFHAGYGAALTWFVVGAPVVEAEELADIARSNLKGGPNYEVGAAVYLDAAKFPGFLMTMNSRDGAHERKFGPRYAVKDGKTLSGAFHQDYGGDISEWWFPDRAFLMNPTMPFDEGMLTAVAQVMGR
ncbi:hypothetical protein [Nonomuraea typhae]|uniref:hypothetical protein n=1 Tax=Nonomuraea typhae TaxID=2603600 RepID=UPI0012FBE413|nr:hypothetical protein [Nonomuraea typhae]